MKFTVYAQHTLTSARCKRVIEAVSKQAAETIALRELANTEWYVADVREA